MATHTDRDGAATGSAPTRLLEAAAVPVAAWLALVSLAVVGRLWQPTWNGTPLWHATPLAATALAAGWVFPNLLTAASVPVAALTISNLCLPGYGSPAIAAVVFAATAWPVMIGGCGLFGSRQSPRWAVVAGGALASSLIFFVSTNAAHWLFTNDYPHTPAGLVACFAAALPFHRWMPVGDLAWTFLTFAGIEMLRMIRDAATARRLQPQAFSRRRLD